MREAVLMLTLELHLGAEGAMLIPAPISTAALPSLRMLARQVSRLHK